MKLGDYVTVTSPKHLGYDCLGRIIRTPRQYVNNPLRRSPHLSNAFKVKWLLERATFPWVGFEAWYDKYLLRVLSSREAVLMRMKG